MARTISPCRVLLVLSVALLMKTCCGQSNAPLTQNLTFFAVRLWTNTPTTVNQGRVDFQLINGVWGTICPSGWNDSVTSRNVNTTCAMLGFRNGGRRVPNTYGDGNKNFLIENATCPVGATSWYQCTQYFKKSCRPEDEELAVECVPDVSGSNFVQMANGTLQIGSGGLPVINAPVNTVILTGTNTSNCQAGTNARLIGGDVVNTTTGNGYVQVLVNGQWGFVCSDTWNQAAAKVVCRELCYESVPGFTPLPGVIAQSVPDPLVRTIALTSLNCVGNETSLLSCPVTNPSAICSSGSILAGVQCRPNCCGDKPTVLPYMNCSSEVLYANFTKARFPLITPSNIFMVNNVAPQCMNVTSSNVGDVLVTVSVTSGCGVTLQQNFTHITYAVSVKAIWVSGTVVFNAYSNVRYDLVCSVPKSYVVTNRMEPYTLAPNLTIYQQYNFSLTMNLYTDCNFTSIIDAVGSVYFMEVGQWLNGAISIDNYDPRTKLVLTDCDAYPVVPYSAYTPVVKLIQDKCPVDPTLTIYQLDNRREGFQVRAFMFAGYSMVYIRCSITICLVDATSADCDRACQKPLSGRKKRSPSALASGALASGAVDTETIYFYDPKNTGMAKIIGTLSQNSQPQAGADTAGTSNGNKDTSTPEHNQQQITDSSSTGQSSTVTAAQRAELSVMSTKQPENSFAEVRQHITQAVTGSGGHTDDPSTSTAQNVATKRLPAETTGEQRQTSTLKTTQRTQKTTLEHLLSSDASKKTATATPGTSSTPKEVRDGTSTDAPQYSHDVQAQDQKPNKQPGQQQDQDPGQDQQTLEQQPTEHEVNSSSPQQAAYWEVSELKGSQPDSATFIHLNSVISVLTVAVWLVYLLAEG